MSDTNQARLLVTGASGQLGRRVVELLLENTPPENIIATTRTPEKLADFAERGVTVRHADFDDLPALTESFRDADRLLIISTDAVGQGDKRAIQHTNAVKAAQAAGVKHVLYTSIIEPINTPVALAPDHAATEQALVESTMGWTFLRNCVYMDMLLYSLPQALATGTLYSATGDGKTAYISREDCARAAAAALASSFEGRRALDITGSEALSQAEIAQITSEVTGQPLVYVPITLEDAIKGMVSAGLPEPVAASYASFDEATAQGIFNVISDNVEQLTGQAPATLREFLTVHKDALIPTSETT